jgi:vancomycin resistance protein VanJ
VVSTSAAVTATLWGHGWIPDYQGLGSVVDTVLPWLVLVESVLLLISLLLRTRWGVIAGAVGVLIYAWMFGPVLAHRAPAGPHDLRVATLNVGADSADPARAVRAAPDTGADLVVLQELTVANHDAADSVLNPGYPFRDVAGTVGVWSKRPLSGTHPVDIDIGWVRALRTDVTTANGATVTLYAAHLASARPGATGGRDHTLTALADLVAADPSPRLIVVGDLNTATTDRKLAAFAALRDTKSEAGKGFGFTFPAAFPATRPDHILQRGMQTRHAWVVRAPAADHLIAVADLDTTP